MQVQHDDDDDLYEGQESDRVKYSKLCFMATKLGQKVTDDDLHRGQQRSNVVYILGNLCPTFMILDDYDFCRCNI